MTQAKTCDSESTVVQLWGKRMLEIAWTLFALENRLEANFFLNDGLFYYNKVLFN